ncbi:uncharacterized protein LOC143907586 isoform X3 [Temnothorax americanus]|uniref:uncharacterized protein LOC143907586 isoform X3 n=1 Tax=Temnothorax americanus TaxID=1964332 RepID=UPI0040693DBC
MTCWRRTMCEEKRNPHSTAPPAVPDAGQPTPRTQQAPADRHAHLESKVQKGAEQIAGSCAFPGIKRQWQRK